MPLDPFPIGSVSLFESAVVGNVFTLSHSAVDVEADVVEFVGRVLIDDALGPLPEGLHRRIVPPLLQIALLVELSSLKFQFHFHFHFSIVQNRSKSFKIVHLVIKTVGDFVPDYDADPSVLEN